MKDYLKRGEGSGDDIEKELKDREPEMELVGGEDEPEGLDPFNKATKDYVYDTALDNLDTDDGLYARVFLWEAEQGRLAPECLTWR